MNRQLQAEGGIMQVAPREKFGLGSKLKKFVRKIIPNEVAEIAVKAAPFVAPFNPALAGAMAGIGSFDQTGSIGDSLKSGALTYGGGQAARYIGGAGFQGNPFASGGAFRPTGFTQGFSSPLGSETGLGKFFSNRGTQPVEGVNYATADSAPVKSGITESFATADAEPVKSLVQNFATADAAPVASSLTKETIVNNNPGFIKTVTEGFKNKDFSQIGNAVLDQSKKFGKAMFTKKDGSIDKAAVMGALAFSASYIEAKALAAELGIDEDLTEAEYDELTKEDKKEEYAGYLTNFFAGKKDGGRIGFSEGTDLEQKLKDLADYYMERGLSESEAYETAAKELYKADGGRIGFKKGSPEETSEIGIMSIDVEAGDDEDEENMMMADLSFSSAEKSFLFKRLGGAGGASRSYTMPQLYRILNNPGSYPSDARALKRITIGLGIGKKDGGRIGYAGGSNRVAELLITRDGILAKDADADVSDIDAELFQLTGKVFNSVGGLSEIPTGKMRKNNAGVIERDYRDEGGFVPVGIKERADDVPAMLSKNEFVMTADAVRGIGGGDVEKGSKKLYNTMKQAEQVGKA